MYSGVTPVISLIAFRVHPSSAIICSFDTTPRFLSASIPNDTEQGELTSGQVRVGPCMIGQLNSRSERSAFDSTNESVARQLGLETEYQK